MNRLVAGAKRNVMGWAKLGLIFSPRGQVEWMATHAMAPFADPLGGGRFAVYFSSRHVKGGARMGRLDIDIRRPAESLTLYGTPCLDLGAVGTFDDAGVNAPARIDWRGRKLMYYGGWTLGVSVPFYAAIGLAQSTDGGVTFERVSEAPVLGRDHRDPYLASSPFVLLEGGTLRMWYLSGARWKLENGRPKHYYHIKHAYSFDGLAWEEDRRVCIDFDSPAEYAIARPCVLKEEGIYRMWYCCRGAAYRIGYAESKDGIGWERKDDLAGIWPSATGWDSEMTAYPFVFADGEEKFMLYNGNAYGRDGIGMARQIGTP